MSPSEDRSIQSHMAERTMLWHDTVTAYRQYFEDAILTGDRDFSTKDLPLVPMITDLFVADPAIMKFHLASLCSFCTDQAVAQGLPRALAHSVKDACFQELALRNDPENLSDCLNRCVRELVCRLREHCRQRYSHTVMMAVTFIHQNLYQNIRPSDVSSYLRKDRTYLARKFREETGLTLSAYIRKAKIDRARQLISRHLYSLTEISEMLGYPVYSRFYRDFRKETGMSPGEFSF